MRISKRNREMIYTGRYWRVQMREQVLYMSWNGWCYELKLLELSNRTTLVLSNIRELDRELFYKLVYLYSPTDGLC